MNITEYTEQAIRSAAKCLQWTASDSSGDGRHNYPVGTGGDEYTDAVAKVPYLVEAVTAFVADNRIVLHLLETKGFDATWCGHTFILTANHHGTGFWDRGLGATGRTLTDACRGYSFDAEFQLDDDGDVAWLCVEGTVIVDEIGRA
jgi:hypothetical protein